MRDFEIALIGAGALFLLSGFKKNELSFLGRMDLPRGIRNNNPGNLKITPVEWKGKIPVSENTDGIFEQFENFIWGLRAMMLDIRNDIFEGKDNLEKLIYEYAPPSENDTEKYIEDVELWSGISRYQQLTGGKQQMGRLIPAMVQKENGMNPVSQKIFNRAWNIL